MEKTGWKIICGALTTLVVKGLMMMMMMNDTSMKVILDEKHNRMCICGKIEICKQRPPYFEIFLEEKQNTKQQRNNVKLCDVNLKLHVPPVRS